MTDTFSPIKLPNGSTLPNRLCKAAMEENMAGPGQLPSEALINLYKYWADGGVGLILSGNVMIAPDALTGPGGVVLQKNTLEDPKAKALFETWARTGKSGDGQFWLQISHPGRQVFASQGTQPVSASATKVKMEGAEKMFVTARALTSDEVMSMVERFADSAEAAERSGFDGVQIHAAHGYLVNQFLSPLTNLREDEWGGSLENRARFLLEIVKAVRKRVKKSFGVGIKLNSADFQRGGFDQNDAKRVVEMLNKHKVDFVELSGGSYESAAMAGVPAEGELTSTIAREMYFIDFAKEIKTIAKMPIMVTGGVTKFETVKAALESGGTDLVGIAKAMAYAPALPTQWQAKENLNIALPQLSWKNKLLKVMAGMAMTKEQLHLMGAGKPPKLKQNAILVILKDRIRLRGLTKRYKKWLANLA
ncbi:MAG: NADH:flavin oxidoreductase/NADH oxidase family protein [Acidimicrobiales bacterium]|nr:NADH:flavin oxidoreductase/NADH oxidase family protein [Hyphomonadaceae bacterium]RZV42201.1 MAG: NADH:flavin oxidoreductase/NADH oxidase family protein [Acidimicrobiales bacterium]